MNIRCIFEDIIKKEKIERKNRKKNNNLTITLLEYWKQQIVQDMSSLFVQGCYVQGWIYHCGPSFHQMQVNLQIYIQDVILTKS